VFILTFGFGLAVGLLIADMVMYFATR